MAESKWVLIKTNNEDIVDFGNYKNFRSAETAMRTDFYNTIDEHTKMAMIEFAMCDYKEGNYAYLDFNPNDSKCVLMSDNAYLDADCAKDSMYHCWKIIEVQF